ncbi:peroxiredoxin [Balneicella halophila]|uniref:Thiol peroxidase n=1 Tax=Balneicella halophila TaxID=1537566 RepID=A0A7L4UPR7_BALHA|nr:thiol peroxidase [Balneicella halophila]PVX51750.1 peroxiredoxin [Balneicella halophila]
MEKISKDITFKGNPMPVVGNEIKVGDKAPDFTVLKPDLSPVKLSDFASEVVVISAAPSVDTAVCATQTAKFNQAANKEGINVLSVSCDLPFALGRFCAAEGIDKAITASDHKDLEFGEKYGFIMEPLRLLARGVVVVDKEGIVQHVEYVPEVTDEPDYDAALEAAKKAK